MAQRMFNTNLRNEQAWLAVGSLMVLATVAIAIALIYTRGVMIPFVLAIFITTVVSPVVDFEVSRLRFPRPLAIFIALMLALAILVLLGAVLTFAVQTIVHSSNEYSERVTNLTERVFDDLETYKIHIDKPLVLSELKARLPQIITDAVGTITTLLSSGFLIMIFVIFLLIGRDPHARHTGIYADIEATIRSYIATKFAISAVTGVLVGVILWALKMPMAWLFGLFACLLNFIPNIGSIAATLLPIPIALTEFAGNPWMILAVVGIPGLIHMSIGNFVEPKLMGRGLELHPVTVLLALAFWGLLWGVIGMVLAVPIVATIRIVVSRFSTTRWLGDLLAGRLPGADQPSPDYLGPVDKPAAIV